MDQEDCDKMKYEKYVGILSSESLPSTKAKCEQKGICFNELSSLINHLENFLCAVPSQFSKSRVSANLCEIIAIFGLVEKFEGEDRDFSSEDFPHIAEYACTCFLHLKVLIREFNNLEQSHKRQFIVNSLLLCATNYKKYFWSNEDSIILSKEFLKDILEYTNHETLCNLLCDENFHPTIFKSILKKMRPSLMKDTWMLNPSSCYMFSWFLSNVKHPHLVDYLPDVFPPPFMFLSYYGVPQKVLGIQCISHLLENIPPTLMTLDGREDVIYHHLYPNVFSKELDVVEVIFPCVLKLPMMRAAWKTKPVYWSEYDKIFYQLLFVAEMENNLRLKRKYLAYILAFTEHTPPFKHLKRLMNLMKSNLTEFVTADEECHIFTLKILKAVIKSCWPRMDYHCFQILTFICGLFDCEEPPSPRGKIYNLCMECLILLKHSCTEKFQALTENYIKDSDMPGVDLVKSVIVEGN